MHLCASYYAFDYVSSKTKKNCQILIEPISLFFLENYNLKNNGKRENIVLFNPRKNYSFTKQIISFAKRKKYPIVFMPLKGYSQDELTKLYSKAKLYIDFGSFPGAERIPKEAVINGCNILTGTNGASGFYGDVPIDNEFKIKSIKSNIKIIVDRIDFMLNNYENLYNRFDTYRKQVLGLEANFEKQLIRLFCENHLRSN